MRPNRNWRCEISHTEEMLWKSNLTSLGEMRTEARCRLFARHLVHHFRKPIDVLD